MVVYWSSVVGYRLVFSGSVLVLGGRVQVGLQW